MPDRPDTTTPELAEPRRGQVLRPWARQRRHRLITITSVLPGYVIGRSSPATGPGNRVLVLIRRHRLGQYQLVEEAPAAPRERRPAPPSP